MSERICNKSRHPICISISRHKIIKKCIFLKKFLEHLLRIQLTRVEQFHSHLEPMRLIKKDLFNEQVIKKK